MTSLRLAALVGVTFFICCLATGTVWEIQLKGKPSPKSRFYVLDNWNKNGGAYYSEEDLDDSAPFPAIHISDVMLKTMGILRSGAMWSGVRLGNLFRRPRATALFLVNGISDSLTFASLSDQSYRVDQTGLSSFASSDEQLLFSGDNVMSHFQRLFEGQSLAVRGSETKNVAVSDESLLLSPGLFDTSSSVDREFLSEVLSVKESVSKLSLAAVSDSAPDVYLFSFTTLRALEIKYSANSQQMTAALKLVAETIQEVKKELKKLYNGDIVLQALVLQWEYPNLSESQISGIKIILEGYRLTQEEIEIATKNLPSLALPDRMTKDDQLALCEGLAFYIEMEGALLNADCPSAARSRLRRDTTESKGEVRQDPVRIINDTYSFGNVRGVVEERSENFSAIFLIIFATMVPLALSLYAISWAMWNMDPGTDSVIYRNTDPVGIKLE